MYLTISTTHVPATDLGYLLHKRPGKLHSVPLSFGTAHVFYPEATDKRCTAALLIEVDPVELVRKPGGPSGEGGLLDQYVNDRPYASSSFASVALARTFGTAFGGRSKSRQELADMPLPLEISIPVLPCRGGELFLRRLFEPLGYQVAANRLQLDERFPEWGESRYWSVNLSAEKRLQDVLQHLYVLLPVLDDDKHYWVGKDEIEKLLRRGQGWLASHPEREEITRRYLKYQRHLMNEALTRLAEDAQDPDELADAHAAEEVVLEERISLNQQRLGAVLAALRQSGAKRVLDLGCGEGRLLSLLLADSSFSEIVGIDVSPRILEKAAERLRLSTLPPRKRQRIQLLQGSLMYRDARLSGYDAAAVVEVVEHLDPPRLAAFERVLFEFACPGTVVMTTPNREYNVKFETMPAGSLRHKDHRFEWTRAEFRDWATRVAATHGHSVSFLSVGEEDAVLGAPTQMAIFRASKA
ncbi:MAG TPA: 3' terminal RNA ribose 2'-O-methyltransferase Hen1 [Candidatus Acidoferrum sp.]|nr:3' terminal RNA ribose 2'-O-methyltransferase Hen1 [Candidatus Acidoferrum sp.]